MSKGINPILMVAVLIVGFIGALAVSYFIMPSIAPEYTTLPPEPIAEEIPQENEFEKYNYLDYGPGVVQRLEKRADSLANIVEFRSENRLRFINTIAELQNEVDSLKRINDTKDEVIYQLENKADSISNNAVNQLLAAKNTQLSDRVKSLSQTIAKLDVASLSPILNLLTDEELEQLYLASEENRRSKILEALNPEKAGKLIRRVLQ
jgi:hypothetical protein